LRGAAALVTSVGATGVGGLASLRPELAAVLAVAAVGAAVAAFDAGSLLVVAFPMLFVARRIGPASLNMSGADLMLVVAALISVHFVPWRNQTFRRVAAAISPSQRAAFEWLHRAAFLFGGLAVGSAIAQLGQIRRALRLLMLAAAAVALAGILQSFATRFAPAYPLGLQKNFAGSLLAMSLIIAVTAPRVLELSPTALNVLRAMLFVGVAATQSRGAVVALVLALAVWSFGAGRKFVRIGVVVPLAALLVFGVVLSVRQEAHRPKSLFTPINSRNLASAQAAKVWGDDRLFGAGLRYYRAPGYSFDVPGYRNSSVEPHSVWYSTLGESGLVGLGALGLLLFLTARALRLASSPLAVVAGLVLLAKLVQGMADIYWVAGTQTLPWLMIGIATAEAAHRTTRTTPDERSSLVVA
jgi:hypothetical protein